MVCVHCQAETQVINSRPQKRSNQVWRRRQCKTCTATFTTKETPVYHLAWLVEDAAGHLQPFSRDKLFLSLFGSLQHRKTAVSDATALTDTVLKRLLSHVSDSRVSRQSLGQVIQVALHRFDAVASTHYAAFHTA